MRRFIVGFWMPFCDRVGVVCGATLCTAHPSFCYVDSGAAREALSW